MPNLTLRRGLATAAAAAVAASSLLGLGSAAQAASPAPIHGTTVDYFDAAYTALGAKSVFETVTIERFEYILKNVTGNVAFFIGDPGNASSQATIGHIQKVAKDRGIERIYNFTPKLDGGSLNVWDVDGTGLNATGRAYFAATGDRLITDYLNKDVQTTFTKNESSDPYLFVYNKDRTVDGQQDRIVAALSGAKTAADLDSGAEATAYENQVKDVLGAVPAADLVTTTNFDFQRAEVNRRHSTSYTDADRYGGDILDVADATDGFRVQTLTYPELVHLLQQPGDIPILFGGTWCHNTRAIIKFVNADAQKYGVKTVYNFDFSLFSTSNGGSNYDHIRDNPVLVDEGGVQKPTRPSHLYGDLVNTYLPNAFTQYRTAADVSELGGSVNAVSYYPGGDTTKEPKQARKIQVGHFLTYNKDHKDGAGNPAPVVDQAIRQNDDGGHTEHMTEWWFTAGRNLPAGDATLRGAANPASETGSNQLQNQRAFAKEAIDEIDTLFKGISGQGLATATTVAEVPGPVGVGGEPTLEVSVDAPGYAPFISLNTANQNALPSSAAGKPRGTVAVLEGSTKIAQARLSREGKASIKLPAQTRGDKSYIVTYLGRGDVLTPSSATVAFPVKGDATTTTLGELRSRAFGAGGTVTASVTAGATGTVTLTGLPGGAIAGELAGGTATFTVPASTPAGAYPVTASYSGDASFGVSTSEPKTLTITKAPTTLAATVTDAPYGTSASVGLRVSGPAGQPTTGQVTVTVGGSTQTVPVDNTGRATVSVPRTLAPKTYSVTAVYSGSGNLIASSAFGRVTVAKGATKAPAFAPKGTVKAKKKGKASLNVSTPSGLAKATGKVRIELKKGKTTKKVTVTLKNGRATVSLPKLVKGSWSVKVTYLGDATYAPTKAVKIAKKLKVKA